MAPHLLTTPFPNAPPTSLPTACAKPIPTPQPAPTLSRHLQADITDQKRHVIPSARQSMATKQVLKAKPAADEPVTRAEAMRIWEAANRAEAKRQAELQAARQSAASVAEESSAPSPLRPFVK